MLTGLETMVMNMSIEGKTYNGIQIKKKKEKKHFISSPKPFNLPMQYIWIF